jgi:hypothetical protein
MSIEQKARFISNTRTLFVVVVMITFLVLWATQLYQFILSIAALGAAMAIASKEVILNFGGTFYRAFARPFSVGDRIEVKEIRGYVVDIGLMSTQMLEVGPKDYTQQYTGRLVSIPNSTFLSDTVYNETDTAHEVDAYTLHVFKVPIKNDNSWQRHIDIILECSNNICDEFTEPATAFFNNMANKRQVDPPLVEPRVNIKVHSPSEIFLLVRVSIPIKLRGTIEQRIIKDYLTKIH